MIDGASLPTDREAEHACLSAIFARGVEALAVVHEYVDDPRAFSTPLHQSLFSAMCECAEAGDPICAETVASELRRLGCFDQLGGMRAIEHLRRGVITRTREFAEVVRREYKRREFYLTLRECAEATLAEPDVSVAIQRARTALDRIDADQEALLVPMDAAVSEAKEEMERRVAGEFKLVPTGFKGLDRLGALEPAELIGLGAPSGTGKTALAMSIARNCVLAWDDERRRYSARRPPVPVLFISGEMRLNRLIMRWLSDITGFDGRHLRSPSPDWLDAKDGYGTRKLSIDAGFHTLGKVEITLTRPKHVRDIDKVCAVARTWAAKKRRQYGNDVPLLVEVDYLQRLGAPTDLPRNARSDERQAGKAAALKNLAQDIDSPVIMLSQVVEGDDGEAKLRGSRAIFHECDRVWTASRPWKRDQNKQDLEREFQALRRDQNRLARGERVEFNRERFRKLLNYRNHVRIGIGKDRSGLADTWVPVEFQPELTRFLDAPEDVDFTL